MYRIAKVCASSSSVYMSQDARLGSDQQDPNLEIDIHAKRQLEADGMDDKLATHFAHLFIRDSPTVYEYQVDGKNKDDTSLFHAAQSRNWQTIHFKPPASVAKENIGWRVVFRSMEVQLTDFENVAFAMFIVLLSQALIHFDVSLYIPVLKVDRNLDQACASDGVISGRLWFVKALISHSKPSALTSTYSPTEGLERPDTASCSLTIGKSQDNRESSNSSSEDDDGTREGGRSSSNSRFSHYLDTSSCGKDPIESM